MAKNYLPNLENPNNLSLEYYTKPSNSKLVTFYKIYFFLAFIFIAILLGLRTKVLFIYQYSILIEVIIAIFLVLGMKCLIKYLIESNILFYKPVVAAKIVRMTLTDDHKTELLVRFTPQDYNNKNEVTNSQLNTFETTETFNEDAFHAISKIGLNSVPVIYNLKNQELKSCYIDLHYYKGEIVTDNLALKKPAKVENSNI